jgi:cobalt/nickel transport system permease protein
MHMSDALLSPAVGGTFWAGTAAAIGWCSRKLGSRIDDRTVPLMGVAGAFVFAAQMVNFTIPGTGSSGHLGGGMILAAVLGPHAAFLVMASILTVQALFFADGGLLALGCNIWNLGIYPCFFAFPLLYRPLARGGSAPRITLAAVVSAVAGLQLGALSVVLQTFLSGRSELPFGSFLLVMQPIHLAIGLVEGFVTAGVLRYVHTVRPGILAGSPKERTLAQGSPLKRILLFFGILAVTAGGFLSWFASGHPDGLEWSIARVSGRESPAEEPGGIGAVLKRFQEETAILPDYGLRPAQESGEATRSAVPPGRTASAWARPDAGTTLSGLLGSGIVLVLTLFVGLAIRRFRGRTSAPNSG